MSRPSAMEARDLPCSLLAVGRAARAEKMTVTETVRMYILTGRPSGFHLHDRYVRGCLELCVMMALEVGLRRVYALPGACA